MSSKKEKHGAKQNEVKNLTRQEGLGKEEDEQKFPLDETEDGEGSGSFDCPVCLQNCSFPVQLPCKHIFCFLCVKGVAHRSKRCAMCRQEIPVDFFRDPKLVRQEDLHATAGLAFDDGYQWFYEGRNGWWQYDERTSMELESRYKKDDSTKVFELLIAGFLYVIDLDNMIQFRRSDQNRRRKIRRDKRNIPDLKGIAGLKYGNGPVSRPSGDGGETTTSSNTNVNQSTAGLLVCPPPFLPAMDGAGQTGGDQDGYPGPSAPNNTPQTPQTPADSPPSSVSNSDPDLSAHLQNLHLDEDREDLAERTARSELHNLLEDNDLGESRDFDYDNGGTLC